MRAVVISLKFHPGHISHLVASYKQCQELGYEVYFYVDERFVDFLPHNSNILVYGKNELKEIALAIFVFPNLSNAKLMARFKRKWDTKCLYIFHEPLTKLDVYRKAGFSIKQMIKLIAGLFIEARTVGIADAVIVPSAKALQNYNENKFYSNKNVRMIPLMYDDELLLFNGRGVVPRIYFSYIGTVASDHSYDKFVDFVKWAYSENRLDNMRFLIATKSTVEIDGLMQKMIDENRLSVFQGEPLTNDGINFFYESSYVIWNAYARTTQSGVLPKAFMFGTPAVVLNRNLTEYAQDGIEVAGIEDNGNKEEICAAIARIMEDFDTYSANCRKRFLETYYYRNHNEDIKRIIGQ